MRGNVSCVLNWRRVDFLFDWKQVCLFVYLLSCVSMSAAPLFPPRVSVPWWVWPGHSQTAGGQSLGDPQEKVVGWWQVSKGGGPPRQRFVTDWSSSPSQSPAHLFQCFLSSSNPSSCLVPLYPIVFSRSGDGEHWRDLRGAGVRPAGCYLHGGPGVCLDVKADAGKRGERGLSNLHLLCLPLTSLAPSPPCSC